MDVRHVIEAAAVQSSAMMQYVASVEAITFMEQASFLLSESFRQGNKVMVAGNGGSLCDAAHFAEELTGCFRKKRRALPAIVLSEMGHVTCVGNDFGFDYIFSRSIEAFGKKGDIFLGLSTSGNSPNICKAMEAAKCLQLKTICLLGKGGGELHGKADVELIVPEAVTSDRIQEVHMACLHIIIEGIEAMLFS